MLLTLTCVPQGTNTPYAALLETFDARGAVPDWSMLRNLTGVEILGAHMWAEERPWGWLCALRVSNGAANPDGTGFCGGVYYRSLSMLVDASWEIIPELRRGKAGQPLPYRLDFAFEGQHYFPRCAQFVRRFALVKSAGSQFDRDEARAALELYRLKIPDPVLSYGPAKSRLPKVNRPEMSWRFGPKVAGLREALRVGFANEGQRLLSPLMGPFQPYGREAYEYGGSDIEVDTGYGQCSSALLWDRMRMDLTIERMAIAAFDKRTGERLSVDTWLKPFHMDLDGDEERIDIYAEHHRPALPPAFDRPDWNTGACGYRPELEGFYDTHNGEHSIRASAFAKAPAEIADDPVAKAYLVELCQHQRQSVGPNLPGLIKIAKGPPTNVGRISLGRSHAESSDIAAWAIHLKPRDKGLRKYGELLDDLLQATAPAHGVAQRAVSNGWDMTAMWQGGFGALLSEDGAQAFEAAFGIIFAIELKTVLGRYGFWRSMLFKEPAEIRAARSLYRGVLPRVPGEYNAAVRSIPHYIVVAQKNGAPVPVLSKGYSKGDISHVLAAIARVYEVTGDLGWLAASLKFDVPAQTLVSRLKALQVDDQTAQMVSALQQATGVI